MTRALSTDLSNWERVNKRVESDARTARYINAETCAIFVGPPYLDDVTGLLTNGVAGLSTNETNETNANSTAEAAGFKLVGLAEAISIQEQQNVQQMFEIGSRRGYRAGGRVMVSGSIGRVMITGPSLLRALYAWYPSTVAKAIGQTTTTTPSTLVTDADKSRNYPPILFPTATVGKDPAAINYATLMSELFSHEFGLGILYKDNGGEYYSAEYIEGCMIQGKAKQISASSTLITEQVSFVADAVVPLHFTSASGSAATSP